MQVVKCLYKIRVRTDGIMGWCKTPAVVIGSPEEAEKFACESGKELCVASTHSRPHVSISSQIRFDTPWERITTVPVRISDI